MALEGWKVARIPNNLAQRIVVEKHYLHRKAPCSAAFGLFSPEGDVVGCCMYGTPSSAPLRSGIAGIEFALDVAELTRLWVDDAAPRNGESFLIGRSVRQAGKDIIVSYADTSIGHIGYVYQSTNWLYTGLSADRTSWVIDEIDTDLFGVTAPIRHGQTLADKQSAHEIRAEYGDRFRLEKRSRKHRYIFIVPKGRRRKAILSALKYPILKYPKASS